MRIAICDNEQADAETVSDIVAAFIDNNKTRPISSQVFLSGADLLAAIQNGFRYEIYLLDILMPGLNGMELAKIIRLSDTAARIIFLTSSGDFAVDSYSVNAYYYLIKPVDPDRLGQLLKKILNCAEAKPRKMTIKTAAGYVNIEMMNIEYVEVVGAPCGGSPMRIQS